MNTWQKLSACLALCLLTVPAARAEPPTITDVMNAIKDSESRLKDALAALRVTAQMNQDELTALRKRIEALELRLDNVAKGRISLYPPQSTGTIRLDNRLGQPATVIVNDVPYRLQPFQARDLPAQPAGPFTFEVLVDGFGSLQPRATRTLVPNQVYTIFTELR
jgi:hypothetical protein